MEAYVFETILKVLLEENISIRQYLVHQPPFISFSDLSKSLPTELQESLQLFKTKLLDTELFPGMVEEGSSTFLLDRHVFIQKILRGMPSFVIVIPSFNNRDWVAKNLGSVFNQRYKHYRVIYMDDFSQDGTHSLCHYTISKYNMWGKTRLYSQTKRSYQSCSRFMAYHMCDPDEVLCMLDGDDWFENDQALLHVAKEYNHGAMVTYGSFRFYENHRLSGVYGREKFPMEISHTRRFRQHRWITCHLRTGYAGLFQNISLPDLLDGDGGFSRCCTDLAEMYPVVEMAHPHVHLVQAPVYVYNKQASLENSNSFYNTNKYPLEAIYRKHMESKIRSGYPYKTISPETIGKMRYKTYNYAEVEDIYDAEGDLQDRETLLKHDFILVNPGGQKERVEPSIVECMMQFLITTHLDVAGIDMEVHGSTTLYEGSIQVGKLHTKPSSGQVWMFRSRAGLISRVPQLDQYAVALKMPWNLEQKQVLSVMLGCSLD